MIPAARLVGGVATSLADVEQSLWTTLHRAATQRRHDWATPTFVTSASDGPQARTVVLRQVEPAARRMVFFTDVRSSKVNEIHANPRVVWLFWDHASRTQLRVAAVAKLAPPDVTHAALKSLSMQEWRDYTSRSAPGAAWMPGADVSDEALLGHTFAVIDTAVKHIDWLKLEREQHLRAVFDYTGPMPTARWIVP